MLTIFYWVLLLLVLIGVFAPPDWTYAPRISAIVTFILFVLIGLKTFKPDWN